MHATNDNSAATSLSHVNTTPQKTYVFNEEFDHDYNAEVASLSFDERMRNLKVSMHKLQEVLDGKRYFYEETGHEAMDKMFQDILQLWSNENIKICDVHELRLLTRKVLEMYDRVRDQYQFYYM